MALLKMCLWRIRRYAVWNLLLVVQIVFFFCAILMTVSSVQEYINTIQLLGNIDGIANAQYWTIDDERDTLTADMPGSEYYGYVTSLATQTGDYVGVGQMAVSYFAAQDRLHDVQLFNDDLISNMRLPLKEGTWFGETLNALPAMVVDERMAQKYPVGTVIDAEFTAYADGESLIVNRQYEITGVLDMRGYIFDFFSGGNALRAFDFFNELNDYAIVARSSLPEMEDTAYMPNTALLFPASHTTVQSDGYELVRSFGQIQSMESIKSMSTEYLFSTIGHDAPMSVILALLGLLGIAISLAVSAYLNERENSIFSLCGATALRLCCIEWMRCLIITVLAMLLTYGFSALGLFHYYITRGTYAISALGGLALMIVMLAISSIQVYVKCGGNSHEYDRAD